MGVISQLGRNELAQHPPLLRWSPPNLHRRLGTDESPLHPRMAHRPRIRPQLDPRDALFILRRHNQPRPAHLRPQIPILIIGIVRGLVRNQNMNLGTLIILNIPLGLAITQVQYRPVPELVLIVLRDILHMPRGNVLAQQYRQRLRPLHVIAPQISQRPPKKINLNPPYLQTPANRRSPKQKRLPPTLRPPIQNLRRLTVKRQLLLRLKINVHLPPQPPTSQHQQSQHSLTPAPPYTPTPTRKRETSRPH